MLFLQLTESSYRSPIFAQLVSILSKRTGEWPTVPYVYFIFKYKNIENYVYIYIGASDIYLRIFFLKYIYKIDQNL